jgi:hypothetical protein
MLTNRAIPRLPACSSVACRACGNFTSMPSMARCCRPGGVPQVAAHASALSWSPRHDRAGAGPRRCRDHGAFGILLGNPSPRARHRRAAMVIDRAGMPRHPTASGKTPSTTA